MMYFGRVVSSLKLLKPIAVAIARIEGDNTILSVLKYIKKREDFCLKPMLDPKYAGKSILSGAEINKAYGVITTVSRHLGLDAKLLSSLAMYTSKQGQVCVVLSSQE